MKITAPAGTPAWLAPFAEQINKALGAKPSGPTALYAVDSAAALPPAKDNAERQVYVRSIARLAISNGVNWLRTDTGAAL